MCHAVIQLEVRWRIPFPKGRGGGAGRRAADAQGRPDAAAGADLEGGDAALAAGGRDRVADVVDEEIAELLRGGGRFAAAGGHLLMNPNDAENPEELQVRFL